MIDNALAEYENRVYELSKKLDDTVERQWKNATNRDIIERYLAVCSDEEYDRIVIQAEQYLDGLALQELKNTRRTILKKIQKAEQKQTNSTSACHSTIKQRS